MKKIIVFLILLFLFSNCQSQKIYFHSSNAISHSPTKEGMQSFFLFGLVDPRTHYYVDASNACKDNKVVMIETSANLLDMFLSVVTFGIYTPRHYYLYCMNEEYEQFLKYKKSNQ